jgi:exonuclease III
MKFGTWNVRSLCMEGLLKTVASELAKYKLDIVAVQEVRWVEGGWLSADDYTLFY